MFGKKTASFADAARVILAGNPNVGKSTLFNRLTGLHVHTGNWAGKTVSVAEGRGVHNGKKYIFSDLPGIASLSHPSAEEISAADEISKGAYDCCVIVLDATNLARSLSLAVKLLELSPRCVVCVNLCDEAEKRGIKVDAAALEFILGVRVVMCSAGKRRGINELMDAVEKVASGCFSRRVFTPLYSPAAEALLADFSPDRKAALLAVFNSDSESLAPLKKELSETCVHIGEKISNVVIKKESPDKRSVSRLDNILCSAHFGIPVMLILLLAILYITIIAANYPSEWLSLLFAKGEILLSSLFSPLPSPISSALVYGVYRTLSTVVSVMLPPMAIFFPFFALLEEFGYLPRVAFNLDGMFKKCGSCGKQALTMCMGLGCNCVGVTGSAIISSKRERLIAVITNAFVPCNGRFGALIAVISMFFALNSSLLAGFLLSLVLVFSFAMTFLASFLLSKTVLRGEKTGFVLELPPYRKPNVLKVLLSSLVEKTLAVLMRAISVAAPAGLVIWLMANISVGGSSLLNLFSGFLDPIGRFMGLDGVILLAFILGFPANEIVLPICVLAYSGGSVLTDFGSLTSLRALLLANGWSFSTAVSFIIFALMHWPCSSTVLTIKNETKSLKWTLCSVLCPTLFGFVLCAVSNFLFSLV